MDSFASAPSKSTDTSVASFFQADCKSIAEDVRVELLERVKDPPVSSEAEMASDSNCACE